MKRYQILITAVILIIIFYIFAPPKIIGPARSSVSFVTTPILRFVTNSTNSIFDFFYGIGKVKSIEQENQRLKDENLMLQAENARLKETEHQNDLLRKEIGFVQERKDLTLIPAQVIARSPVSFMQYLTIDKGSRDGLEDGLAAVAQGVFIGKIINVKAESSEVMLTTNTGSLVPVLLQESRGTGILHGSLKGLEIQDIPLDVPIKIGENVITSGLGDDLPQGLLIGKVEEITSKESEIFQKATVKPLVEFSSLEIVFVVGEGQ